MSDTKTLYERLGESDWSTFLNHAAATLAKFE
jgi:hypothetical protein